MKLNILRVAVILAMFVGFGCGSDDDDDDGNPSAPTLGDMIDRAGRAAVSTALISPFESDDDTKNDNKNNYNEEDDDSKWSDFSENIAGNLAILDGINRDCTDSFYNDGDEEEGAYDNLAGALADDRLYILSQYGTCEQYLAAELVVINEAELEDCGGRAPTMDVVETTYSALVAGKTTETDDNITEDDAEHSDSDFPFLAAPL